MKLLWSLDDDWTAIPDWNPAKLPERGLAVFDMMCKMADALIVSTDSLREVMLPVVDCPVYSAPNLIDLAEFPNKPNRRTGNVYDFVQQLPVRVMWSGSVTHAGDIEQIIEPIDILLQRLTPEDVQIVFMGVMPPVPLLRKYLHKGVTYQPQVSFETYRKVMAVMRPDVILAPLSPVAFNESKSSLRILESWGMMAVPIASDFGPYQIIDQNINGLKIKDDYEWVEAMEMVCRYHTHRFSMAISGRLRLEAQYNWDRFECRKAWNEAFASILDCPVPSGNVTSAAV